jgi:hypothetical protein
MVMILVTGDVVLDHNIYEGTRLTADDREGRGSHCHEMPGGAVLTYELLKELAGDRVEFGLAQKTSEALRKWPQQFQTRAIWHLVANGKEASDGRHWALKQQLGYGQAESKPHRVSYARATRRTGRAPAGAGVGRIRRGTDGPEHYGGTPHTRCAGSSGVRAAGRSGWKGHCDGVFEGRRGTHG